MNIKLIQQSGALFYVIYCFPSLAHYLSALIEALIPLLLGSSLSTVLFRASWTLAALVNT